MATVDLCVSGNFQPEEFFIIANYKKKLEIFYLWSRLCDNHKVHLGEISFISTHYSKIHAVLEDDEKNLFVANTVYFFC